MLLCWDDGNTITLTLDFLNNFKFINPYRQIINAPVLADMAAVSIQDYDIGNVVGEIEQASIALEEIHHLQGIFIFCRFIGGPGEIVLHLLGLGDFQKILAVQKQKFDIVVQLVGNGEKRINRRLLHCLKRQGIGNDGDNDDRQGCDQQIHNNQFGSNTVFRANEL